MHYGGAHASRSSCAHAGGALLQFYNRYTLLLNIYKLVQDISSNDNPISMIISYNIYGLKSKENG